MTHFKPAIIEGGKKRAKQAKDDAADADKSIHRLFIEFLSTFDFRAKDGHLARWSENHWSLLSNESEGEFLALGESVEAFARRCSSGIRLANEWLYRLENGKKFASDLAEKILASAMMILPPAPRPPRNPVIPCLNGWIEAIPLNDKASPAEHRGRLVIRAPDRSVGIFHVVGISLPSGAEFYEPKALPPESRFAQFIEMVQPDALQRQAVQEFCGYVLLANGSATEQKHHLWMGSDDGRNGKGTMIDILKGFLPERSVAAYDLTKIDDKFANAALVGSALAIVDETPKAIRSPGKLKSMLGEGVIVVEKKFKDPVSVQLRTRFILLSNHWPKATEGDRALWNRFQFIEWGVEIPAEKRIAGFAGILLEEEREILFDFFMSGILSYIARGRLMDLASSEAIRKQVALSGDPVAAWLEESGAFLSVEALAPKEDIYDDFFEWSKRQGHPTPLGATGFWPRIKGLLSRSRGPSDPDFQEPPRPGRGGDRRQRSNLVLPKHAPEEARLREGEAPEPCPFEAQPVAPGEAEKAARERWIQANPQAEGKGSYSPEWDAILPHAKAILREAVAEGVGREGIAARMAAKFRSLGGHPPAGMEEARHRFVEALLD